MSDSDAVESLAGRSLYPLELRGVARRFRQGEATLEVLDRVDLIVEPGQTVALVGPSGAGKSTLLHIAGLLESADDGDVLIDGELASTMSDARRSKLRRDCIGFVFQHHGLLPEFTARDNVVLPQMIAGVPLRKARERALQLLQRMGLAERAHHQPGQLSGGEQQRVAVCRALANSPRLLLADEPTGNLDPGTSANVFGQLLDLVRESGLATLIATHNPELAARMDRIVTLRQGRIETVDPDRLGDVYRKVQA